jgi:hypothetical protein
VTTAIAKHAADLAPAGFAPLSADAVRAQVNLIQEVMKGVMREGEHFGRIPGCGDKPALLKAGAEKIGLTFRLIPTLKIDRSELGNGHREYAVTCTLTTPAGEVVGEGVGCCSTMESKYRWRSVDAFEVTDLPIPPDAKEKKAEYRKQGYGMRKVDGGWAWVRFTGSGDRQENPDIADLYNTVLKMAKKRAFVDAILTATAASDIFTQDIEEVAEPEAEAPAKPAAKSAVDRAKVAAVVCKAIGAAAGLEDLATLWKSLPMPAGFLKVEDEHSAAIRAAKDKRKAELTAKPAKDEPATEEQRDEIETLIGELGWTAEALTLAEETAGIKDPLTMTAAQAAKLIAAMRSELAVPA